MDGRERQGAPRATGDTVGQVAQRQASSRVRSKGHQQPALHASDSTLARRFRRW